MAIKFTPIASESMGVRSMCSHIETEDVRILLDAGVSLGQRFRTPPHPLEYKALKDARESIRSYASRCNIITISHYHFDHYTATWREMECRWTWSSYREAEEIYGGKIVYAKDYRNDINPSQRRRGYIFNKIAQDFVKEIRVADSTNITIGETELHFTRPLPHGEEGSELGYIVALEVRSEEDSLLYCPDVQGPIYDPTLRFIERVRPRMLVIGGPPTYLTRYRVSSQSVEHALANLRRIVEKIPLTILDHHILREEGSLVKIQELKTLAEKYGNDVVTYAENLGLENMPLEARRLRLYEEFPPTQEFQRWMKLNPLRQRLEPPPLSSLP